MPASESVKLVERYCVVCGLGSHRADWADTANPACDSHSKEEVAAALSKRRSVGGSKTDEQKPQTRGAAVTEKADG